jgi:transcriptional regulator with XRE-family HTH domain
MVELRKRFGQLLAAHRKRRGLKQADLAEKARLSLDMIAKLEVGSAAPSFAAIERLAEALEVDPAEFFTHELGGRPYERRALTELVAQISGLKDPELGWLGGIVSAVLKPRT